MVYQSFLIKYAEIGTKGKNRYLFEDALIKQIKNALKRWRVPLSLPRSPAVFTCRLSASMITMR